MYCAWLGVSEFVTSGFVFEIFMKDPSSFTRHNWRIEGLEEYRLIGEALSLIGQCQSRF